MSSTPEDTTVRKRAWSNSVVLQGIRRSLTTSNVVDRIRHAPETVRSIPSVVTRWVQKSTLTGKLHRDDSTANPAVTESKAVAVARKTESGIRNARSVVDRWSEGTTTRRGVEWGIHGARRFEHAARTSVVARATREGGQWMRGSWLYRWLTAEPDAEVVVIDLRDTLTVRPFIDALDGLLGVVGLGLPRSAVGNAAERTVAATRAAPVRVASALAIVGLLASFSLVAALGALSPAAVAVYAILVPIACFGLLVDAPWEEVQESRPIQLLVAALEPPEPPEQYRERGEETDDRLSGDADEHMGGTDEGSDNPHRRQSCRDRN